MSALFHHRVSHTNSSTSLQTTPSSITLFNTHKTVNSPMVQCGCGLSKWATPILTHALYLPHGSGKMSLWLHLATSVSNSYAHALMEPTRGFPLLVSPTVFIFTLLSLASAVSYFGIREERKKMNNKIVRKQAREVEIGSKYFLTVSQARDLTVTPVSLPNVPLFSSLLLLCSSLNTVQAHKEALFQFYPVTGILQ